MAKSSDVDANALRDRLRAAHVDFELARWRGEAGTQRAVAIGQQVWDWAESTRLDAVIDEATVRQAAVRLALDLQLPDELAEVIGAIADHLVRHDINRETRVRDVVDQSLYEDGVALFIELEALRSRLIKRLLDSPVYTAMASDVLYQGIKDYIFSDTGAINSIPGVSKLLKSSSSAVSKRMPGLEAQVEKRVKSYIESNTEKTLARSEALLLESLDEERIRAIADEIWAETKDKKLSIDELIDQDELQKLVDYGFGVWKSLRETEYLGVMVEASVSQFFERYGDRPLSELAGWVGLDQDTLIAEVETLAPSILVGLDETGLLETLVTEQVGAFYEDEAFEAALKAED